MAEGHGTTDIIGGSMAVELPHPEGLLFTSIFIWDKFLEDVWSVHPRFAEICNGAWQHRHVAHLPLAVQRFVEDGEHYPTTTRAR